MLKHYLTPRPLAVEIACSLESHLRPTAKPPVFQALIRGTAIPTLSMLVPAEEFHQVKLLVAPYQVEIEFPVSSHFNNCETLYVGQTNNMPGHNYDREIAMFITCAPEGEAE